MKNSTLFVSAAALILAGAATASSPTSGFTGAYAPGTWTTSGLGGGASVVFSADGQRLTITGGNGSFAQDTDATHTVVGGGTWSFNWSYTTANTTSGFDNAFYLLNGTEVFLATAVAGQNPTGTVSLTVATGDIIGWRVDTVDGIFGPGTLNIDRFEIPAPGALALLGLAGLAGRRRRA